MVALVVGAGTFAASLDRLVNDQARFGRNYSFALGDDGSEHSPAELRAALAKQPDVDGLMILSGGEARVVGTTSNVGLVGVDTVKGGLAPRVAQGPAAGSRRRDRTRPRQRLSPVAGCRRRRAAEGCAGRRRAARRRARHCPGRRRGRRCRLGQHRDIRRVRPDQRRVEHERRGHRRARRHLAGRDASHRHQVRSAGRTASCIPRPAVRDRERRTRPARAGHAGRAARRARTADVAARALHVDPQPARRLRNSQRPRRQPPLDHARGARGRRRCSPWYRSSSGCRSGSWPGRGAFRAFVDRIGALPDPTIPAMAIVAIPFGLVLLANLAAVLPARRARRLPTATLLRVE